VLVTALDVTEPATISKSIEMGITRFGRIDAVINNAGFGLFGVFEATSDIQPLIQARRETSEDQYIALMRAQFLAKPGSIQP